MQRKRRSETETYWEEKRELVRPRPTHYYTYPTSSGIKPKELFVGKNGDLEFEVTYHKLKYDDYWVAGQPYRIMKSEMYDPKPGDKSSSFYCANLWVEAWWFVYDRRWKKHESQIGSFNLSSDPLLLPHSSFSVYGCRHPENCINQDVREQIMRFSYTRREDDRIIPDRYFFACEWYIPINSVSWRFPSTRCIANINPPCIFDCDERERKKYLYDRYCEAVDEYMELRPGTERIFDFLEENGLDDIDISEDVLYQWHIYGRHIHGFFLLVKMNKNPRITYLYDIFNHFLFPMYISYDEWDEKLKLAFDFVVAFNLNMAEFYAENQDIIECCDVFEPFEPEVIQAIQSESDNEEEFKHLMSTANKKVFKGHLMIAGAVKDSLDGKERSHVGFKNIGTDGVVFRMMDGYEICEWQCGGDKLEKGPGQAFFTRRPREKYMEHNYCQPCNETIMTRVSTLIPENLPDFIIDTRTEDEKAAEKRKRLERNKVYLAETSLSQCSTTPEQKPSIHSIRVVC